jgi:Undecaprenyl-phosphate galactose phosphotransferase WbaP
MSTTTLVSTKPVSTIGSPSIENPHRAGISALLVFAVDVLSLWLVLTTFLLANGHGGGLHLWPLLSLFLVFYSICGAYPGISVSPVDDIKRITIANIGAFFFVSLVLMSNRAPLRSQLWCVAACAGASFTSVFIRSAIRRVGSLFRWWGYPVVLFGGGDAAISVLRKLRSQPFLGLRPVAVVTDRIRDREVEGVAICRFEHLNRILSSGVKYAIVAAPELSHSEFAEVLERGGDAFPHLIIIPDTHCVWKVGSYTRDLLDGTLGLQVRNNLLCPKSRVVKRVMDLGFCVALAPLVIPILAIISIVIAAESGYPVFFCQKRIGHDGRVFCIWKFRTMVRNAAEVLEQALVGDPDLQREWTENHKLRKDLRITQVGKILRKTSLDELPQLWNVMKGEMSLVGPRPIVQEEVAKYKESYSLYVKTIPGLTGLWQVSGRNQTTYAERVAYDAYYVRNWSVWMDVYLLAKTVNVILTGYGAY